MGKIILGGAKIILASGKIILGGANVILASGKIILGGAKIILAGGKIILAGQVGKLFCQVGKLFWHVWSPPNNPIQSECEKHANSCIMQCEEFILPDWSPLTTRQSHPVQAREARKFLNNGM